MGGASGIAVFDASAGDDGAVNSPFASGALFIACCSSRKYAGTGVVPVVGEGDNLESVAARWLAALRCAEPIQACRDLYAGRAFRIVRDCADRHSSDLAVISAGLGFVEGSRPIPAYDISPDAGDHALVRRVPCWEPRTWWSDVRTGPYASDLVATIGSKPVALIALTASYARLIAEDLEGAAALAERVRIFGRDLPRHLPSALHRSVMPYDDRLERIGRRGTMGDFAARALEDFADGLGAAGLPEVDAERVTARLAAVDCPVRALRSRVDDARLASQLASWRRAEPGLSRSTILRRLRDVEGIACSDGRLRRVLEAL